MYTERQDFPNRRLRLFCLIIVILQMAAIGAAETGRPFLPFGYPVQLGLLLLSALMFGLLTQTRLVLRVGPEGLAMRYFPYQWRFQHLGWNEIRRLHLLPQGEQPAGASYGRPARDYTHVYLLSDPRLAVLSIVLVNGTQLYLTAAQPKELLDFLQNGLTLQGGKIRAGQL